jgi:chorismate mutase/prephenate dehydratase
MAKEESRNQNPDLQSIRKEINDLDARFLDLLAQRRALSQEVIKTKLSSDSPVRDFAREQSLLADRISLGREKGLDSHYVTRIFHEILEDSIRIQHSALIKSRDSHDLGKKKVAYHGLPGAYCELACEQHSAVRGVAFTTVGYPTFSEVVKAVSTGEVDYALIPVENTTLGVIKEVLDLLLNSNLHIVGEEKFRIDHCLLAVNGASLDDIERVHCSHLSFLDCKEFVESLCNHLEYQLDSAIAARTVASLADKKSAAIASERAAEHYGLSVLKRGISTHRDNFVRSLLVSKTPETFDLRIPCKTSLVFATANHSGALVEALQVFRDHGINLSKLESHPIKDNPWQEMFYLDLYGNLSDDNVANAIKELTRCTRFLRVMGSYPSIDIERSEPGKGGKENEDLKPHSSKEIMADEPVAKKSKSYSLASRDHKSDNTVVKVGAATFGAEGSFFVIAGPCSVESEQQIMQCAQHAKEHGVSVLRGGCFKPRTSPYAFQGLGLRGIELLRAAGSAFGLPIVTEVMAPEDVQPVAKYSDMLQIGARNMQNFNLLKAVGAARLPVMLKRGMSSSIDDLLNAAEYILAHGNHQVILCERGIRTFETATRATLDLSAVPVLKRETHLPVIVDPSHAAGDRALVPSLAMAARAVGADGVMIEFHPEPEKALSDGPQALRFHQFAELMKYLL